MIRPNCRTFCWLYSSGNELRNFSRVQWRKYDTIVNIDDCILYEPYMLASTMEYFQLFKKNSLTSLKQRRQNVLVFYIKIQICTDISNARISICSWEYFIEMICCANIYMFFENISNSWFVYKFQQTLSQYYDFKMLYHISSLQIIKYPLRWTNPRILSWIHDLCV